MNSNDTNGSQIFIQKLSIDDYEKQRKSRQHDHKSDHSILSSTSIAASITRSILSSLQSHFPRPSLLSSQAGRKRRPKRRKKQTSFNSEFEVTEYESVLGDNPGGHLMGAPVSLGWNKKSVNKYNLDQYEDIKSKDQRRNDPNFDPHVSMIMKDAERKRRLQKNGVTLEEYIERATEIHEIRKKRDKSSKDHHTLFHKIRNVSKPMAKRLIRKEQNRHKYRTQSSNNHTQSVRGHTSMRSMRK